MLKVTGLYYWGKRNAAQVRLVDVAVDCPGLAPSLDGFTVLQLSDLHLDNHSGTADAVLKLVDGLETDVCVLTGDYVHDPRKGTADLQAFAPRLTQSVSSRHGVVGILGNHDSIRVAEILETHGVRALINESIVLDGQGQRVCLTGVDDVHVYRTPAAEQALQAAADLAPGAFHIALVHSPELADVAAQAGFGLYLTGHTHGGQICWPGGKAIVTNLRDPSSYVSGRWQTGKMVGYTSRGAGVSLPPVRFNCPAEITRFMLHRA